MNKLCTTIGLAILGACTNSPPMAAPIQGPAAAGPAGAQAALAPSPTGNTAPELPPPPAATSGQASADDAGQLDSAAIDASTPALPQQAGIVSSDLPAQIEAWWSYDRPAAYEVSSAAIKVPMRDGARLACTLSRPATSGVATPDKHPSLLVELTPYALQADQYQSEAAYFVKRGYNTLVCLLRGIGESAGTWQHPFAPQDALDAHDLVEWLAQQAFSDGNVGAFGESYGGATTYGAAVEQAPHLRAIAPMQAPGNLYDDVHYPGGIETVSAGPLNLWPTIAELMSLGAISADAEYALYRAHPTYDQFWQERTFRGQLQRIQVPVLALGGWTDNFFRSGMLTNIEPLFERTWAIYGDWVHTLPVDLGTCESQCAPNPLPGGVLLAWFDRWVMGMTSAPIPEKPLLLSFESPREHGKGWRTLTGWTAAGSDPVHYEISADATLVDKASSAGPLTFQEPGDKGLVFTTAALDMDRVLIGRATLELRATLSGPDANFYLHLLDVDERGTETFVNDGYLKASHRSSHTEPSPVPMGQTLDYQIEIRPQHYRFRAGHRLRIQLWGGPADSLVQPTPVEVAVEAGPHSILHLPGFAGTH